ncbi:DNA-directed DNA polymerase [Tanacetum coccineum]|uniref:DNA-directed DNA polymerase n=1 Tax=Tanacetum coccineum TaxID=301880 RepID=A0ABQ5CUA5_9ASTR
MASQDVRLSKFKADFKQQQSEMTNKIDTVLKAITDRIAGALPSDMVKNPKLNASLVLMGIGTKQTEEPKSTLEDEFQDLHLNLPILEVLAHAPIYNAILGDLKPFDTLADLGSCVNIIPLYLFKKLNIGLLEETDHISGLADETKSYPVGIVKDVEVHIGKLKLLNDFYYQLSDQYLTLCTVSTNYNYRRIIDQEDLQQAALDEALVPIVDQVKTGSCNMRIDPTKTQKEATYQLTLDILKLTMYYNAFHITANVAQIYMQ